MDDRSESVSYLAANDILEIHELIVDSDENTDPGVISPGDVEYVVEHIRDGHFGQTPESLHEVAFHLLRLIAANHPFVDGNKRTALMSVRIFYALNGVRLDYDRTIKDILKEFATDERGVNQDTVLSYLRNQTEPLSPEYQATVHLWLSRIEEAAEVLTDDRLDSIDDETEPNHYDRDSRKSE